MPAALLGRKIGMTRIYSEDGKIVPVTVIQGALSSYVGFRWPVAGGAVLCLVMWVWAHRRRRALARALEIEL